MMPLNAVALADSDIGANLVKALSSETLWVNIAKTVIFILLGFFFIKKKLLPENTGKVLTKFVMTVCLPCLAFCSFMSNFTVAGGIDAIVNFVMGFVFYIGFIFLGKLIFLWVKDKKKRTVLAVLFAFGSTTFFGYPLTVAIYGAGAGNNFNIMNVAYRVFLYSYAYLAVANLQESDAGENAEELSHENAAKPKVDKSAKTILKKVFLNPIVIATFAGLILWVLQAIPAVNFVPHVDSVTQSAASMEQSLFDSVYSWFKGIKGDSAIGVNAVAGTVTNYYAFWRIDKTLPWIYQAANTLGGLSSTIILFAIGCTLGGTNIKDAATDKYAWIWTALKVVVAPAVVLLLLFGIQAIAQASGWLLNSEGVSQLISSNTLNSSVITWMVPPATVAVGYCISFDQEKEMASHISLIGTFGSVIGIIIWVVVLTAIGATGFFA